MPLWKQISPFGRNDSIVFVYLVSQHHFELGLSKCHYTLTLIITNYLKKNRTVLKRLIFINAQITQMY